ncbi:hypothetical protein [Terriglobus roseus]|uniref:hypothetical protein n=1 Tax=Terriglobus roseus TaxID=392734 RepID=UPI001BAE8506|nr:hypothetical protein [Terriglobus roseus]
MTKNLLSNLVRTKEHPTLRVVLDIAEAFRLTLDGAHQLFGYQLDAIRHIDRALNGSRTHIVEAYSFYRDLPVDLPFLLVASTLLNSHAALHDLVSEWQTQIPIRAIEGEGWRRPGSFYIHVGTEDSLGSSLPPGSMALVEPISRKEELRPNPRATYLLQFGNGYRCCKCLVTGTKLILLPEGPYPGVREFRYPGMVRVAGRVRMFALSLPMPDYPKPGMLPPSPQGAPLILPWEHPTRDRLFLAKHRRFTRRTEERAEIRDALHATFGNSLTERTERRYRLPSESRPHVDSLIQMVILNTARYSDAIRWDRPLTADRGHYSLDTLLTARNLAELIDHSSSALTPQPIEMWNALREQYTEWPEPLSARFPDLRAMEDRIVRLPVGSELRGTSPPIPSGSILLLNPSTSSIESVEHTHRAGAWSRPIYALRRGAQVVCGYLRIDENHYALGASPLGSEPFLTLHKRDLDDLRKVCGVAVLV